MPIDNLSPHILQMLRVTQEATHPLDAFREQISAFENSSARQALELINEREKLTRPAYFYTDMANLSGVANAMANRYGVASDFVRGLEGAENWRRAWFDPPVFVQAQKLAAIAGNHALPRALEHFRTPLSALSDKLLQLPRLEILRQSIDLEAFARTSAISDYLTASSRVDHELRAATQSFALSALPAFDSLTGYRSFLDAAGLHLSHWPRVRLLSKAEKRRQFRERLNQQIEPVHIKKAKSLVHRYELTFRDILDAAMAEAYGEDWAEHRLPMCNCKDLLGKWRKRGGAVLDHADYAHYARIMSDPEHFETVFEVGFDDPAALAALLTDAGRLRAASHHARAFTPEDLRDLRMTWRVIETGLLAFTDDYEIEP